LLKKGDSKGERALFLLVGLCGLCFVIQIWRDSTLFACIIFAYGLLVRSLQPDQSNSRLLVTASVFFAFVGCLFKPVFSVIIAFVWVLTIGKSWFSKNRFFSISLIGTLLFLGPILLDKYLTTSTGMVNSHPEQQVMIYDLAKLRCWSGSVNTEKEAKSALLPLAYSEENFAEICGSLTPSGWDSLHTQNSLTQKSPALKLQTGSEVVGFENLRNAWIGTVLRNPISWVNIKTLDASQVLFMANSFYAPDFYTVTGNSIWLKIGDKILQVPMSIAKFLDKSRMLSLFSSFIFGFIMLIRTFSSKSISSQVRARQMKMSWQTFLGINLIILLISTLAYLANNGRYILPFILLNYLFAYQQSGVSEFTSTPQYQRQP